MISRMTQKTISVNPSFQFFTLFRGVKRALMAVSPHRMNSNQRIVRRRNPAPFLRLILIAFSLKLIPKT